MSLDGKASPVGGSPASPVPAPISRMIQLKYTVSQPVFAAFLAGGVAGAVSRTVVSPLERLKILFQIQSAGREEYKLSVGKGLAKMWKEEGWRGFMRGNGTNYLSPLRRLVCGGAAGITSVTFTYPLDIVRTRLSIQSASFAALSEETRRKLPGMWGTMVTMYKTEGGIMALYRGILPTVAGVAPYVSINGSVFTGAKLI
ncbi:MAG: hypothetical protein Q9170_005154 [Blastenia crenularia]